MRTAVPVFSTIVAAAAALMSLNACSDDRPPAQDGVTTSSSTSSSSGGFDGGRLDDGAASSSGNVGDVNSPELCGPIPQKGTEVEEWAQPREPPAAYGGAIAPGTYTLTWLERYVGPQPPDGGDEESSTPVKTGAAGRATLIVTANSLSFLDARGQTGALPTADTRRALSYTIKDNTLVTESACPTAGTKATLTFDAHASIIYIFPDATHREQYDLVP